MGPYDASISWKSHFLSIENPPIPSFTRYDELVDETALSGTSNILITAIKWKKKKLIYNIFPLLKSVHVYREHDDELYKNSHALISRTVKSFLSD